MRLGLPELLIILAIVVGGAAVFVGLIAFGVRLGLRERRGGSGH